MIFQDRKKKEKTNSKTESLTNIEIIENKKLERPRICCIDIGKEVCEYLERNNYNLYKGTLGKKIKIKRIDKDENFPVLLNCDFPINLHEYDIIIIDLDNFDTIEYDPKSNIKDNVTGKSYYSLISSYPETIFDPRPYSCSILREKINEISNHNYLIIVFTTSEYNIEYEIVSIPRYSLKDRNESINIYSFLNHTPLLKSKVGKEIVVQEMNSDLKSFFEKYRTNAIYNQTFRHPTIWANNTNVNDPKYFPIYRNIHNEIVSYFELLNGSGIFVLPQIDHKKDFLYEFLEKIAPDLFPELFPFSTQFKWKENEEYGVPNYLRLLNEKENLEKEYKTKLEDKDKEISENYKKFSFLHDLITLTGNDLVLAAQKYFKWLGFHDVRIMDKEDKNLNSNIREEDIQIDLSNGLLIIEIKGIGGTSTDSDCSQISKIKHRRCEERNSFDVYALYLVNHQRYLPPLKRQNPPFTEHQIKDARNDKRGLLSTWQLFNLYFEILNKTISKEEAREQLTKIGLVTFSPSNLIFLDEPKEFFHDGFVCIIKIKNITINVGDELFIEKNDIYYKVIIKSIKLNDVPVKSISQGEIGIELDKRIRKKSKLWIKNTKK
jgi:hypothetical protein